MAGVILDSSIIIAAERRGQTVLQILEGVRASQGDKEVGLSVVTIAELVHGAYRAKTTARQERRLEFIDRLTSDVPVHPVSLDIARLAGRIEGQQEGKGIQIAFEDLLIGATALHLDYAVATLNRRDFRARTGPLDCAALKGVELERRNDYTKVGVSRTRSEARRRSQHDSERHGDPVAESGTPAGVGVVTAGPVSQYPRPQ